MINFNGSEFGKLIFLRFLYELSKIIDTNDIGIYSDGANLILRNSNSQNTDKSRNIFRNMGFDRAEINRFHRFRSKKYYKIATINYIRIHKYFENNFRII